MDAMLHLVVAQATRVDDGIGQAAGDQILLSLALPDQDVAVAERVQPVLLLGDAHRRHQDYLLHASRLGSINLPLLPLPVHLCSVKSCHSVRPLIKCTRKCHTDASQGPPLSKAACLTTAVTLHQCMAPEGRVEVFSGNPPSIGEAFRSVQKLRCLARAPSMDRMQMKLAVSC